jgi:hypothetical protein
VAHWQARPPGLSVRVRRVTARLSRRTPSLSRRAESRLGCSQFTDPAAARPSGSDSESVIDSVTRGRHRPPWRRRASAGAGHWQLELTGSLSDRDLPVNRRQRRVPAAGRRRVTAPPGLVQPSYTNNLNNRHSLAVEYYFGRDWCAARPRLVGGCGRWRLGRGLIVVLSRFQSFRRKMVGAKIC